jgi:type IV pilus assembly protein PilY1
MLHAFDARNLEEYFAYVPSAVHHNLWRLADPEYNHKFYVDGQVAVGDAKLGSDWGTYLVGTLGAGGRGVYALDVTDPKNFSEDDVLWELTAEDDPDIGFTYGEPLITRLEDGTWVTIFGNGYNSQDDKAYLFVVDLADGEILQKIAAGDSGANGLSGVSGWRDPVERTHIRRVYAGDLEGTMWRFDFEDSEGSLAFKDGLFEGDRPITSSPSLAAHPSGGLMVYYGTGKFIEGTDKVDTSVERFYGIRDRNDEVSQNELSEVNMQASPSVGDEPPQRTLQGGADGVGGWFVDLRVGEDRGEKVLVKPQLGFAGRVNFSTFEPVDDPCTPGGIQRTYLLNSLTGGGRSIEIGSGAPISPPIAIKPPVGGPSIGDLPFPGNPNPGDPGEPDYPPAPDPTGGDPEGWCSEIGIPPLFEGGEFLSLGQICEGRQVWREIQ